MFSFLTGTNIAGFTAHDNTITGMCVLKNQLITCSLDTTIKIWDLTKLDSLPQIFYDHEDEILSMHNSDEQFGNQYLVSIDRGRRILIRDLSNPNGIF